MACGKDWVDARGLVVLAREEVRALPPRLVRVLAVSDLEQPATPVEVLEASRNLAVDVEALLDGEIKDLAARTLSGRLDPSHC